MISQCVLNSVIVNVHIYRVWQYIVMIQYPEENLLCVTDVRDRRTYVTDVQICYTFFNKLEGV